MQRQITRDNHYVPQWYQRGFLAKGRYKLHVLNLHPSSSPLPNGQILSEPEMEEVAPKRAFNEFDLYTTRFGKTLNDDIETFLFGKIDKSGADAVRGWIAGDPIQIHRRFLDFFAYMDAQKLRTPKGLDWILKHYQGLSQMELMTQMQKLRQMHCTMWSEGVREIVSAAKSSVKFLVSDHPVTIYHQKLPPYSKECLYPSDPGIDLIGSQTIFALDANHCLILTNIEYTENSNGATLLSRRTNARFRGEFMARTDAFIRSRNLGAEEVHAINLVLKSRARKFVAASNPSWLYPEQHCTISWEGIAEILLPRDDLSWFGGEVYIGYKDGSSAYRDRFGRTSKAHELLKKPPPTEALTADAPCGCGGGLKFRDCCADVAPLLRPSWSVMSIRERNLALIGGINHILRLDNAKTTWLDVRRNLSNDQVRQIHEIYAALWPTDTRLIELLPSPQTKRSRALYLGLMDARTVSTKATGMLAYVDELVLAHPFVNANGVSPEFSPIHHPEQFLDQTLRNVFLLMVLETDIRAGRIHLIPDPLDYDAGFREEIITITKRTGGKAELGPFDKEIALALGHDEMMRAIKRLPPDRMKAYLQRCNREGNGNLTDADIDGVVRLWKKEVEKDPLSLLDPVPSSSESGEFKTMKCFSIETGLYVATLTGSFVYTDSDTQWARLHNTDDIHHYESDPAAAEAVRHIDRLYVSVPTLAYHHPAEPSGASRIRALLRSIAVALRARVAFEPEALVTVDELSPIKEEGVLTYKLKSSVPRDGFLHTDVSRLVLTFGRMEDVVPVRLALFLRAIS